MSEPAFARVSLVDARASASPFHPLRSRLVTGAAPREDAAEPDLFALGFAAGEEAATEAFERERAALAAVVAAAEALQPEPTEELALLIAATVEHLVTELVGMIPVERPWLVDRIARAMACIEEADAARTLWLHPDDIALLGNTPLPLEARADDALERGALRIDCAHGWVEDSRSVHLAALRAALGVEVSA
jgi:flagellar assembly protein FliH